MAQEKVLIKQYFIIGFVILSITLITFMAYKDMLYYFFTAMDTLTLIDTSRITSSADIVRIFTEPMMNGTRFAKKTLYYRPIVTLSFSLDYFIWKLNPLGYHLTNLLLHIFDAVLVFFLVRLLTNNNKFTAWLSAIIFTTHPILVESVPGNARRQDSIAVLFLLLSMILFLKHHTTNSHKKYLQIFSLFFYILALGSKELSIIFPFLITSLTMFSFLDKKSFIPVKVRLKNTAKSSFPYFIVTFIYLCWRTYVLQGIGGRTNTPPASLLLLLSIAKRYSMALIDPYEFIGINNISYLLALISALVLLLSCKRAFFTILNYNSGKLIKVTKILLAIAIIFLLIGILAYLPIRYFISQYPEWQQACFFLLLSVICLTLTGIYQRENIHRLFMNSKNRDLKVFLLIWLSLPFTIYVLTLTFSERTMYIPVIPFSIFMSIMLVENVQSILRKIKEYYSSDVSYDLALSKSTIVNAMMFIIIAGLSVLLLADSPLVRSLEQWEASGNISSNFLTKLSKMIPELPNNAHIYIYDFPECTFSCTYEKPYIKDVPPLGDYSLKSWLDMRYPGNQMKVTLDHKYIRMLPNDLYLEAKVEGNKVVIIVKLHSFPSSSLRTHEF